MTLGAGLIVILSLILHFLAGLRRQPIDFAQL